MNPFELQLFADAIVAYESLAAETSRPIDDAQPGRTRVAGFNVDRAGEVYYADIRDGSGLPVVSTKRSLRGYLGPGAALMAAVRRAQRRVEFERKRDIQNTRKDCQC